MWWLILSVNLAGSWDTQIVGQTLSQMYLRECFWMRFTFGSVDWVKQTAPNLLWVSLIQSVEALTRTNVWVGGNSCLTNWAVTRVFASLWTWTETLALPESQACGFLDWNFDHWLSWFSGLWTHAGTKGQFSWVFILLTTDLGAFSASANCEIYLLLVLFLWRALTNTWIKLKHVSDL